eukprot:7381420-Prymnesium_polylepis.1
MADADGVEPEEMEAEVEAEEGIKPEVLARWKHMMSKILAQSEGISWDAMVSTIRTVGYMPVSEEALEEMMLDNTRWRRRSISQETRMTMSGEQYHVAAAAAAQQDLEAGGSVEASFHDRS